MQIQNFSIRKLIQNFSIRKLNFELYKLMNLVTSNKYSGGGRRVVTAPPLPMSLSKQEIARIYTILLLTQPIPLFYYYYYCATIESLTDTNPFVLF